jgi:hypothetical protein
MATKFSSPQPPVKCVLRSDGQVWSLAEAGESIGARLAKYLRPANITLYAAVDIHGGMLHEPGG